MSFEVSIGRSEDVGTTGTTGLIAVPDATFFCPRGGAGGAAEGAAKGGKSCGSERPRGTGAGIGAAFGSALFDDDDAAGSSLEGSGGDAFRWGGGLDDSKYEPISRCTLDVRSR